MSKILAIDPGTNEGAYVVWEANSHTLLEKGILPNKELLNFLRKQAHANDVFCEMIQSYGMAVGQEVFDTCVWVGQAQEVTETRGLRFHKIFRKNVKLHHCLSNRATDANVSQVLRDKYGVPGTKKNPGPLFGVVSHIWSALAIATYVGESACPRTVIPPAPQPA
jgi:hypothetical protein